MMSMDPALHELFEEGDPEEEVAAVIRLRRRATVPSGVRVVTQFGEIVTCRLRRADIPRVRADENVESMKGPRLFTPEYEFDATGFADFGEETRESDERRPPGETADGRGVVIGVIDWGVDFAHPDFINDDGTTRLLAFWDQRARPEAAAPSPYGYGEVFTAEVINRALKSRDPYAALGYHPADADADRSGTHGTHVLGIAAGNGRGGGPEGVAPAAELVFVHLSMWGKGEQDRIGDSVTIVEALDFVARTAGERPWVVNMSLGRHAGPHDGSTLVEQALDAAVTAAHGRAVVQSAGNYFDRRAHSAGQLRPGESRTLDWKTDVADTTPNELDVWYPGQDRISVELRAPDGTTSRRVDVGERDSLRIGGREVSKIYNRAEDPNNLHNHIDIFLYPGGPAGEWEVTLFGEDVVDGRFHAWIERDAACYHCQSHFDPRDAVTSSTTGTLCNGFRNIAVGAYNAHAPEFEMAPFSSGGPTRDGRIKPDLVAPGVYILAARSAPRHRHPDDSLYTRKSGTSMAAPHVTGTVALMFEVATQPLRIRETRRLLLTSTRSVPAPSELVVRVGSGVLDTARAVELTRRFFEEQPQHHAPKPHTERGMEAQARRLAAGEAATAASDAAARAESFEPRAPAFIGAAAAEALRGLSDLLPGHERCEFVRPGDMIAVSSFAQEAATDVETNESNDTLGAEIMNDENDEQQGAHSGCGCQQSVEAAVEADYGKDDSGEAEGVGAFYADEYFGAYESSDESVYESAESNDESVDESNFKSVYESDYESELSPSFKTYAPSLVELADAAIAGGGAVSPGHVLNEMLDTQGFGTKLNPLGSGRVLSPAVIYDAFTPAGSPALRQHFESVFEVICAPSQSFAEQLRAGDLLVRRGEGGLGHLAVIAAPGLLHLEQLNSAGLRPEGARAGLYAHVVEGGAFPHASADGFARLVFERTGRVPHGTMVLRLRHMPSTSVWESDESLSDSSFQTVEVNPADGPAFPPSAVIDERIDVDAQFSLQRMSRGDASARADAVEMLTAVKETHELAGIFGDNLKKAAELAARRGTVRWELVPKGEDAALILEPGDTTGALPPTIIFRGGDPPHHYGIRKQPQRLDAALRKAWNSFLLLKQGRLGACRLPGQDDPATFGASFETVFTPGGIIANIAPPLCELPGGDGPDIPPVKPPFKVPPCAIPPKSKDDPSALSVSPVGSVDFTGTSLSTSTGKTLAVRGTAFFPAKTAGSKDFNDAVGKKVPIVFLAHGNHATVSDPANRNREFCAGFGAPAGAVAIPNHKGYSYFQEQLAAMGIISVSVDCNQTNCDIIPNDANNATAKALSKANITERAELIAAAIKHFQSLNSGGDKTFGGHIDFAKVGLFGHSRGGEAVLLVPELSGSRAAAGVTYLAVISLAPTDVETTSGTPRGFAFMTILPAGDGDVIPNSGARFYDKAVPSPCKVQLYVEETNHNFFNTEWVNDDPHTGPNPLSKGEHKQILSVYGCAFYRSRLLGHKLEPILTGREIPLGARTDKVQLSAEVAAALTVEDHEDGKVNENSLSQKLTKIGFAKSDEVPFTRAAAAFNRSFFGNTKGLVLRRSSASNQFTSPLPKPRDLTGREVWIRAAEIYVDPLPSGATGFMIGLVDASNTTVFIDSDQAGGLPRPYRRRDATVDRFDDVKRFGQDFSKTMPKTFRFPAKCFTTGSKLDITKVKAVLIHLNRGDNRTLAFDQLQIV